MFQRTAVRVLIPCLMICWVSISYGQIFNAGFVGGLNASQIRGDDLAGFDKLGLHGGLVVTGRLDNRQLIRMEILYSQRGSRRDLLPGSGGDPFTIRVNYIETPIMYTYKDWDNGDGFYHFHFSGGFSYGRLFEQNADNTFYEGQEDNFNKSDFSWLLDATYFSSPNLGFGLRYTRSINLLFDSREHAPGLNSLRGFYLSFRAMYLL